MSRTMSVLVTTNWSPPLGADWDIMVASYQSDTVRTNFLTPESGHVQCSSRCPLWSKADICAAKSHVRFTPENDIKCKGQKRTLSHQVCIALTTHACQAARGGLPRIWDNAGHRGLHDACMARYVDLVARR